MALIVETFPNPFNPNVPLSNAYAWIYNIVIGTGRNDYSVEIWIHEDEAAASVVPPPPPLDRVTVVMGDVLVPAVLDESGAEVTPAVVAPTLLEVFTRAENLKQQNSGYDIWTALRTVIYNLMAQHHKLAPCTVV